MKLMKTQDAVGQVLCHDITQIIPGVSKGPVFCKGHVIAPEDVPVLLSVGKDHVYIWENDETVLHENDAAEILRQLCQGAHMQASEPKEGKIELTAACDGLFLVDSQRLTAVNSLGEMMIATRHGGTAVKACLLYTSPGTQRLPLPVDAADHPHQLLLHPPLEDLLELGRPGLAVGVPAEGVLLALQQQLVDLPLGEHPAQPPTQPVVFHRHIEGGVAVVLLAQDEILVQMAAVAQVQGADVLHQADAIPAVDHMRALF